MPNYYLRCAPFSSQLLFGNKRPVIFVKPCYLDNRIEFKTGLSIQYEQALAFLYYYILFCYGVFDGRTDNMLQTMLEKKSDAFKDKIVAVSVILYVSFDYIQIPDDYSSEHEKILHAIFENTTIPVAKLLFVNNCVSVVYDVLSEILPKLDSKKDFVIADIGYNGCRLYYVEADRDTIEIKKRVFSDEISGSKLDELLFDYLKDKFGRELNEKEKCSLLMNIRKDRRQFSDNRTY